MTESVTIGDATLHLGDCREILPTLGQVEAVVTDPPFSIRHKFGEAKGSRGKGTRVLQWAWDENMSRDDVVAALRLACDRARSFFTFCGLSQATLIGDALAEHGFTCKPAAWVKECPAPAGKGNWWPSAMQMAVYGYRTGAWFGDDDPKRTNVFVADAYRFGNPDKNGHPTQTPLVLMERYVRSMVRPGGLALDPFMGSGTTGVAAIKLGRKFIGIEIERKFFDIACQRISTTERQQDMFIRRPAPAAQLSLIDGDNV
jgi:site-specific DNA-methyltransferase (adenine-specific)